MVFTDYIEKSMSSASPTTEIDLSQRDRKLFVFACGRIPFRILLDSGQCGEKCIPPFARGFRGTLNVPRICGLGVAVGFVGKHDLAGHDFDGI
jgi:hypothetical protein